MPWALALGAALNWLGGQQAASQQSEANRLAAQQVGTQNRIVDYMLGRRQRLYDPIEEEELIPRLRERTRTSPWYAADWLKQSRGLRRPMLLGSA